MSFKLQKIFIICIVSSFLFLPVYGQSLTIEDMVSYERQSNFITEFNVPVKELGLRGITTDSHGNVWFYHSTNQTSTIFQLESETGKITEFKIKGDTVVDVPIINLAGGQLVFDESRKLMWFTDARTNAVGKLHIDDATIELIPIPTKNAGPMGITLSPDDKTIWVAEIIGNKIAKLDIETNKITEYPTGEDTGPTLLTFDDKGILWATMSYSNNILRIEPGLVDSVISAAIIPMTIPKPDRFSPFGIAVVTKNDGSQQIFASDHGSSRVIVSNLQSDLQQYISYWTSPSTVYPDTLPSQIIADKQGNIYFAQHGGNRISKISIDSGTMTEYDLPTGPLSTVVYLALSDDGKVWFTEWSANKVGYLDIKIAVPFELQVSEDQIKLQRNTPYMLDVKIKAEQQLTSASLDQLGLALIGMSDSGLQGVKYDANPQWIDLSSNSEISSTVSITADNTAPSGFHNIMIRASVPEKDELMISKLSPISISIESTTFLPSDIDNKQTDIELDKISLNDITKFLAVVAALALIGFLIYGRIKRAKTVQ